MHLPAANAPSHLSLFDGGDNGHNCVWGDESRASFGRRALLTEGRGWQGLSGDRRRSFIA
jgi:hypothetical protein